MIKKNIPVFFSIDDHYVPFLAVAISSLIDNASTDRYNYTIHVLHQGVKAEHQKKIKALARDGFKIEFTSINKQYQSIKADFSGNKLASLNRFTLTIFFRLFIPDMFLFYGKGIYLDSDICVTGDISELYEQKLGRNLLGACSDLSIQQIEPFTNYVVKVVGVDKPMDYINSGVLLMDLRKLRWARMGRRFLDLNAKYHFDSVAPDQDYINSMCKGRILYLDPKWDAMSGHAPEGMERPGIIHYNLFEKPWLKDGVQFEEYFWQYAGKSGFLEEIKAIKAAVTQETLDQAAANADSMIKRSIEIAGHDNNMADVFGSGLEKRL